MILLHIFFYKIKLIRLNKNSLMVLFSRVEVYPYKLDNDYSFAAIRVYNTNKINDRTWLDSYTYVAPDIKNNYHSFYFRPYDE